MTEINMSDVKAGLAALATTDSDGTNVVAALWAAGIFLGRALVLSLVEPDAYRRAIRVNPDQLRGLDLDEAARLLFQHEILRLDSDGD